MEVTNTTLRVLAAVCDNPALVSMFKKCHTQGDLDKLWGEQHTAVEGLAKNWEEKAGLIAATSQGGSSDDNADSKRSMDSILQEFINSVRCIGASLTIADLSVWLNSPEGSPGILGIKEEFREKFEKDPEAALVFLTQHASDVLIAGKWI